MNKIKLKLHECYALEAELNGVVNQETGQVIIASLISETKKLTTKYWLNDLAKKVAVEKDYVESLKQELIKKYGEADEQGSVFIPMYINIVKDEEGNIVSRDTNPKFMEFQSNFNDLLNEEKEVEYKGFKLEEFEDVEAKGAYSTLFKLIEVSPE
jgi:hypothetical protein